MADQHDALSDLSDAELAGVGTSDLEIVEDCPEIDYLFCPIGGGSSAAGHCLTVGAFADATVVGAQSEAASSDSFESVL